MLDDKVKIALINIFKKYKEIDKVLRLEEALKKDINDDIIVNGIIQRCEFTFEQAWKVMKL